VIGFLSTALGDPGLLDFALIGERRDPRQVWQTRRNMPQRRSRPLAFRLSDFHHLPLDRREPLIDVVLVGRFNDCLAVAADEGKDLSSFLHG
jgi:hypothetical protein